MDLVCLMKIKMISKYFADLIYILAEVLCCLSEASSSGIAIIEKLKRIDE